ncbi:MAG: class I SAM-dependent methyltransferase [Planctomycetes bacterium]|nr:class I SAM-dependent methyltransferase [Planctomycetota bacterium]
MAYAPAFTAAEYDAGIGRTIPHFPAIQREILTVVAVRGGVRSWLDVGCGTGTLVQQARECFPEASFTLCDRDGAMLHRAHAALATDPSVEFLQCDVRLLALPAAERFSVITAIQVLHYLAPEERPAVLRTLHDRLEPGGMVLTVDNTAAATGYGVANARERWRRYQRAQGKTAAATEQHLQRYGTAYFPVTLERQITDLRRVGFAVVEVFWFSCLQAGIYAVRRGPDIPNAT